VVTIYSVRKLTHDGYSFYGDGEEIIGKWFKRTGKRDDIFLATKFGYVKGSPSFELDTSYEYTKKACAESLRLLDVECLDLCKFPCLHSYQIALSHMYSLCPHARV
jgi:aryl-alcohol dehydrogenase-like predicted oxidoreductase